MGEEPSKSDAKTKRRVNTILKRGKIVNRDEYDLIRSLVDSIFANAEGDITEEQYKLVDKYDTLLDEADFIEE